MNWENILLASEHLAGFIIVMLALGVLWGLTALVGQFFKESARKVARDPNVSRAMPIETVPGALPAGRSGAPSGPAAVATQAAPADEDLDDDLVIVAAAAAAIHDARHRIVAIRPQASAWGQQGRREIHASHRIR